MDIYGFYHVWCVNNYEVTVEKQLLNIKDSGLLEKTKKLYIGIIGDGKGVLNVTNILIKLNISNYEIKCHGTNILQYEFPTLNIIDELADYNDFYCYYLHTKGVSYFIPSDNLTLVQDYKTNMEAADLLLKEYDWLRNKYPDNYEMRHNLDDIYKVCMETNENMEIWREYMEYFIINQHEKCIKKLDEGYYGVGTHLHGNNRWKHFRGNFWWSKSSHIRRLRDIKFENKKVRRQAELWLCTVGEYHNFYMFHNPTLKNPIWVERLTDDYKNEDNWCSDMDILEYARIKR